MGEEGSKLFSSVYRETCELVECLCEQMSLYYSNTLTTMVMIDSDSQDWEDEKCFHEGKGFHEHKDMNKVFFMIDLHHTDRWHVAYL